MRSRPPTKIGRLLRKHASLSEVLLDKELARLGDAYVNLIYSLAETYRTGRGSNSRVPTKVLAESLRNAGLRSLLPKRTPTHDQADAVEALIVYAWLTDTISLEESVSLLSDPKEDVELFTALVEEIVRRLRPTYGKPSEVQGDQA